MKSPIFWCKKSSSIVSELQMSPEALVHGRSDRLQLHKAYAEPAMTGNGNHTTIPNGGINHTTLVGGWATPLKNMKGQLGWFFPTEWKNKEIMFQTTNQHLYLI